MRIASKKCFGLTLVSGLLLLALLHVWNARTSRPQTSTNDIQQRRKLLEGKIPDINAYRDIAYHIKEDVAWCVMSQNIYYFVNILLCIFIFTPVHSISIIFIPNAVVWLKIHVCVRLMRPFTCHFPICCSHVFGHIILNMCSWTLTLTLRA